MTSGYEYGVYGRVASGKSTFLLSLFGETEVMTQGNDMRQYGYAYCPQIPFLHEGSVRDNTLFGSALSKKKLHRVIQGCSLGEDELPPDTDVGKSGGKQT